MRVAISRCMRSSKNSNLALPASFAAIHGRIGVLQDHLSRLAAITGECNADARTD